MRDVFAMDATGLHALEEVHARFTRQGVGMVLDEGGRTSAPGYTLRRTSRRVVIPETKDGSLT